MKAIHFPETPFVGLRPYDIEDSLTFLGRSRQIVEVLQKLYESNFVAILGYSGSGKSSFIRAGLIPKLRAGFLVQKRDEWRIIIMKPGVNPLRSLAEAILYESTEGQTLDIDGFMKEMQDVGVEAIIRRLKAINGEND